MDDDNADMGQEQSGVDRSSIAYRIVDALVRVARYSLVLLIIPAGLLFFWPPFEEKEAALQKLADLTTKRDALLEKKNIMQDELNLIRNNAEYLEIKARDRLHMQKDGEIVMQFEKNDSPPVSSPPVSDDGANTTPSASKPASE